MSEFMPAAPWPALRRQLVAILRGITPDDIEAVGGALIEAGVEAIEVPLNSPDALKSIARLLRVAPPSLLVGAGTVLRAAEVEALANIGGRLVVSPNTDAAVLQAAAVRGMVAMPGVFTPSEAFLALRAGASLLKFFPASVLGPAGIAAIRAVLPQDARIGVVGGVGTADFSAFMRVGVRVFGLGTSLYVPGRTAAEVGAQARAAVVAYDLAVTAG
ncbi:MAG: 2-dehydro-3-deoxy-6-phosphogalactonate aldolase [Acidocella sp. 20-63-7]|nr:MAG: 2-dehydro-3-deoxy-6-phosphogalactonate aldolase [Acidocella sp. 20-63-7]HQT47806.1 2-dehydro-3-deoxy-6-phosphogalactonate aldolase [Acidocella sp.]